MAKILGRRGTRKSVGEARSSTGGRSRFRSGPVSNRPKFNAEPAKRRNTIEEKGRAPRGRIYVSLEIEEGILTDEAVHGFLTEWIVPAIVDRVIQELTSSKLEEGT
jgi:hypothetical protein